MDNKDLSIVAALAKSVGGGGGSTPIPTPTTQDVGKVIKVDDNGAYELAQDEGQNTFAGLTDTTITNPTNGQVPVYNSTTNKWENGAVPDDAIILELTLKSGRYFLPNDMTVQDVMDLIAAGKDVYLKFESLPLAFLTSSSTTTSYVRFGHIYETSFYYFYPDGGTYSKKFQRYGPYRLDSISFTPTLSDAGKVVQVNSNGVLVLSSYTAKSFKLGDISYSNGTLTVTLNNQGGVWNRANIDSRILDDGFGKWYFTYNNDSWNRLPVVCRSTAEGMEGFIVRGFFCNPNALGTPKYTMVTVYLNRNQDDGSLDKIFIEEITPST